MSVIALYSFVIPKLRHQQHEKEAKGAGQAEAAAIQGPCTDGRCPDFQKLTKDGHFLNRPLLQRVGLDLPNIQLSLPVRDWIATKHNHP